MSSRPFEELGHAQPAEEFPNLHAAERHMRAAARALNGNGLSYNQTESSTNLGVIESNAPPSFNWAEIEVMALVARAWEDELIARKLDITEQQLADYLESLRQKLSAKTGERAELEMLAQYAFFDLDQFTPSREGLARDLGQTLARAALLIRKIKEIDNREPHQPERMDIGVFFSSESLAEKARIKAQIEQEKTPDVGLTPRQRQFLEMLGTGMTMEEIASQEGIRPHYVQKAFTKIFRKIGVYNHVGARLWARHNLLSKDETWQDRLTEQSVLTLREIEIIDALVRVESVDEVADTLVISGATVRSHLKNIYKKMNINSREELLERIQATKDSVTLDKN